MALFLNMNFKFRFINQYHNKLLLIECQGKLEKNLLVIFAIQIMHNKRDTLILQDSKKRFQFQITRSHKSAFK